MMWILTTKCDLCIAEMTLEVESDVPPYSIGEKIETCPCGGKYVVEEIKEILVKFYCILIPIKLKNFI